MQWGFNIYWECSGDYPSLPVGYNISFQLCDFLIGFSHNESITDDLPIPNWLLLWSGILFLGFRSPVFRLWMIRQSIPNRIQTQFFQFTPITYKKLKITGYLSSFIALKSSCSEPAFISRKTALPVCFQPLPSTTWTSSHKVMAD